MLKEADIRPEGVTFHGLRHAFATLVLRNREHPKVVRGVFGHSRISETMDRYSHFLPSMQKEAAKRLNDLF